MKRVLCFGDSNTYGYSPFDGTRFPKEVRWSGILADRFSKDDIQVIEEGLVGRTTVFEDSVRVGRKGTDFLLPLIESHYPIDTLVLMLGTNDCKTIYKASPYIIGRGIEILIQQVKDFNSNIKILLVSPIFLGDRVWEDGFDPEFNEEAVEKSHKLKDVYKDIANKYGCSFLAASDYANPSETDQEHMNEEGHRALSNAIYEKLINEKWG